jgi:hypothetical protein
MKLTLNKLTFAIHVALRTSHVTPQLRAIRDVVFALRSIVQNETRVPLRTG